MDANIAEAEVKSRIVEIAGKALDTIDSYFSGRSVKLEKVNNSFKLVGQATKIMQMNQVRILTERSQALRWLPYLADEKIREEYIKLTNPQAAILLLKRPESTEKS